jgi:hypothetical protein
MESNLDENIIDFSIFEQDTKPYIYTILIQLKHILEEQMRSILKPKVEFVIASHKVMETVSKDPQK